MNPLIKSQQGSVVYPCESSGNEFGADSTTENATTLDQNKEYDLNLVVQAWSSLPSKVRAAIVLLVSQ